jgi:type I restriction enzyme, S subunit
VYRSTELDDDGHVHRSSVQRHIPEAKLASKKLAPGDILLEASGGTPGRPVGRVGLYSTEHPEVAICSNFLRTLRPKPGECSPYLRWVLMDLHRRPEIWRFQQQTTGMINLHVKDYLRHEVEIAPPAQQQQIAKILSTVDEAIEQTETLIAKTQQIKAGLMHDLFTRGVTADGQLRPPREEAPQLYKESPLGWIPKEWAIHPLSELANVNRGKFSIRPRNDPRYYNGQYPFIQTGDVALAGGRVLASYSQNLNSLGLGVSRLFPAGTIMVTIAANIADTCILGIPMCAPDSLVGVVPDAGVEARFLELCIRRRKRWFESRAPQTAQKNINLEDLRPMLVPYPEKAERSRIAELYEAIDAQLLESEEAVTKLAMFKRGLMQDLLTGRVSARVEATPQAVKVAVSV